MTREKEIERASVHHLNQYDYSYEEGEHLDFYIKGFTDGAKWADEHPNHDSLWHEPSEEPKDETHILIEYDYLGSKELLSYNIGDGLVNWERLKKNYGISRWAYISDLLPKGGKDGFKSIL